MQPTRLPRADVAILVGIAVYALITFLPWSHERTVAGVSVFAWMLYALMVMAPLAGLAAALRENEEE
ncbi:hypothetical protein CLV56_1649 [Mumia flava]|uniref:Uncharacterized protein n=1 Tax=Mumia flava TaxID=1348852 RepID=A0A0B2BJS8_9ACTN|nr:hypothetical protein [Mumia flava]PJJ57420.1 hypothetical protein CLV56_1649 [Mumia flava]